MTDPRESLGARVEALIDRLADGSRDDAARDALLEEALAFQHARVAPYRRVVESLGGRGASLLDAPAVPTDVFRHVRVAVHGAEDDVRVFRTSGTTDALRGAHHLRTLSLYDRAARAAARYALFPDVETMALVILAPRAEAAPDSSLSHMLSRFDEWFGRRQGRFVFRDGALDVEALVEALARAQQSGEPVALLGTSFAFVHACDALGKRRFALPRGSRVMQTGGFKGRSRAVSPGEMLSMLERHLGVEAPWIASEYGMTELSSQLYETTLREAALGEPAGERRLWVPGWVRATPVDAQTLRPVADGDVGLLRVDDLANLDTACAVQTSDRALRVGDGVRVLGRAPGATPRGCSIAVDAVLSGARAAEADAPDGAG